MVKCADGSWAYVAATHRADSRELLELFKKIEQGEKVADLAKGHGLTYAQVYYGHKRWAAKGKQSKVGRKSMRLRMFTREFCLCASILREDAILILQNPMETTFHVCWDKMCELFPKLGILAKKSNTLDWFQALGMCEELQRVPSYTEKIAWLKKAGMSGSYLASPAEDISVLD